MPLQLTPGEEKYLSTIAEKFGELHEFLSKFTLPNDKAQLEGWFNFLNLVKAILGNLNNDLSFVATVLAKAYLLKHFPELRFDASLKSQSAPGLDVAVELLDGRKLIGEIKTVDPYKPNDFGAKQREEFLRDFRKLSKSLAHRKYLFVTQPRAFDVIRSKYQCLLPEATVVCLTDGREFTTVSPSA